MRWRAKLKLVKRAFASEPRFGERKGENGKKKQIKDSNNKQIDMLRRRGPGTRVCQAACHTDPQGWSTGAKPLSGDNRSEAPP